MQFYLNFGTVVTLVAFVNNGTGTSADTMVTTNSAMVFLDNDANETELVQLISLCWRDNEQHQNIVPSNLRSSLLININVHFNLEKTPDFTHSNHNLKLLLNDDFLITVWFHHDYNIVTNYDQGVHVRDIKLSRLLILRNFKKTYLN